MNLMNVDGYHAKLTTTRRRISFAGKFLDFLEEQTFMGLALRNFAENSKSHWTSFLRYARSKESPPVDTIQVSSIFGFRLNYTRNWR